MATKPWRWKNQKGREAEASAERIRQRFVAYKRGRQRLWAFMDASVNFFQ